MQEGEPKSESIKYEEIIKCAREFCATLPQMPGIIEVESVDPLPSDVQNTR